MLTKGLVKEKTRTTTEASEGVRVYHFSQRVGDLKVDVSRRGDERIKHIAALS